MNESGVFWCMRTRSGDVRIIKHFEWSDSDVTVSGQHIEAKKKKTPTNRCIRNDVSNCKSYYTSLSTSRVGQRARVSNYEEN